MALCSLLLASPAAHAEGSKELNSSGGNRVFLEWNPNALLGGDLARRTRILVYAQAGETIHLGSSVSNSSDSKDIVYTSPSGAQTGVCDVLAGGFGLIDTRAKELAGPLPNAGGYTPCVVTATETGVYLIEFHGATGGNPTPQAATAEITTAAAGNTVTAWDVTVRSGAVAFTGRVFTPYLSVNMGNTGQSLSSNVFVQTRDGYQYRVDFNGVDPFGFILVANRTGFTLNGKPTFQSLQLADNGATIPTGYKVGNENVTDLNSFHKIFFNPPNPSLPTTAAAPGGTIWLNPPTAVPGDINNVTFTGQDGTPGQFAPGTGGTFSYNALGTGTVQFALDLNNDGIYGNANDRVLFGTAEIGTNTLIWDGKDAQGVAAPTTATIRVRAELAAGDVHFPYIDGETNTNGLIIERLTFSDANKYTVYWDDTSLSPVVSGTIPLGTQGTSSVGGSHRYPNNYGDNRGIDTWALYPSGRPLFQDLATPGIVDVSVTKTHSPAVLVPGQPVTYTITVTNTSALARANGVRVTDTVPAAITGVTWTCVPTGAAVCAPVSGSGNAISTIVNLPPSTSATFTVVGTLSSTYGSSTISNTATVARGRDTTDPNLSNNTATNVAPIDVADVGVVKTGFTTAAPLSDITYTLVFTNNGPTSATVTPRDTFSDSTFVSASDGGTAAGGVVTWPAVTLANGQSVTRTVVSKVRSTAGNSVNTASFTSNKTDLVGGNSSSTVTTTVQPTNGPDLVVEKTGTALIRGQNGTFSLLPRNIGLQPTTGTVTITDPLDANLTFVSGSGTGWTCSAAGQNVTCSSTAAIAAGASGNPITLTVLTGQGAGATVSNSATISGGGDSASANNSSSVTVPTSSLTDVQLTKTPTDTAVTAGTNIVYTLTASTAGPSNAAGVTVSDPLPSNVTYVSSSNSGAYNAATRTVTWPAFALNVGTPVARTVTVTPPLNGNVVNTATVSTTTPESNTGNNSAASTLTVTPRANLEIRKEGAANFAPLANLTYTVRVANFGPSAAESVTVTDTLPPTSTYVSNTGGGVYNAVNGTVTWTAAGLDVTGPNSNLTYTVTVLTPATGTLSNIASVSSVGTDPTPGNNSSTANTAIVPVADVQVSKTGPATVLPNGDISYTISVLNAGPSPATAVTVTDLLPAGATRQNLGGGTYTAGAGGGGTITWTLAALASGATQTYTVVLGAPNTSGTLVNGSRASSPVSDPNSANNDGTNSESQASTTVNVSADVQISKTAPAVVRGGGPLSYTITVTNAGPADADGAALQDPAIAAFTATGVSCVSSGNATCPAGLTVGTLQAGTTIPVFPALGKLTITLSGTAANGGQIVNTATATAPSTRTDPTLVNLTNSAAATTDTVNLTLSKTVENISAGGGVGTTSSGKPGETLEYCVTYTNIGSAPLPNLTLSDPLPPSTKVMSASTPESPNATYLPGSSIRFVRTPARTPTPDALHPSNAADSDAGTLETALSYVVGTAASGETGTVCFRVNVK
ncbi:DUF11 domain-containing protein [Deinococcus puniceus]|uniref:DUF11 domain-containing protein n=1 Tax=Deinococcus puniceus TaxID=1182568 RepID=A0A172TBL4_9DEIO|nr:DUF11 domain-containing protein [Deinococcus puniceus]ANE44418.1 hypothetical protein SU48_12335 [Deinococcus puniceus]